MANMQKVEVGKVVVNTHIITRVADLDQSLHDLLSIARLEPLKRVIGLCVEKQFAAPVISSDPQVDEKVAALMLCCGETCLIIKLPCMMGSSACRSVSKFLQLEDVAFVGFKMRYCLKALEESYGIKCRNGFELSETVKNNYMEQLKEFTLIDFAWRASAGVHRFLDKTEAERIRNAAALSDWGAAALSQPQIKATTLRAFLCFYVANHYLRGYVVNDDFWKHPYHYESMIQLGRCMNT